MMLRSLVVLPLLPTLAYLDGGTGSMLLQTLLAGALTGVYVVKLRWTAIRQAWNQRVAKKH